MTPPPHTPNREKPTIVLVHGAWADTSIWTRVARQLRKADYRCIAVANPLRSLGSDADYVNAILESIDGPILLVGHSYGATVIANTSANADVRGVVFVNGWIAADGETVAGLAAQESAIPINRPAEIVNLVPKHSPPTSDTDVYLKRTTFLNFFATGLSDNRALTLWSAQRPVTVRALTEPSGLPIWNTMPSWYLIGTRDKVFSAGAQHEMADKARATIARFAAGHLGLVSDPDVVTGLIVTAAHETC